MKNSKSRGEWAELQFMAKAAKFGLRVSKPWGELARYDVVIETGGRFVRVQVKSTMHLRSKGCYVCGVRPCKTSNPYRRGEFDFVASLRYSRRRLVHHSGESCGSWEKDRDSSVPVQPNREVRSLQGGLGSVALSLYKEAWDLLRSTGRAATHSARDSSLCSG
jgi:hypothetical protein